MALTERLVSDDTVLASSGSFPPNMLEALARLPFDNGRVPLRERKLRAAVAYRRPSQYR